NCRDATTSAPFPGVRAWDTLSVNGVRVGMFTTTVVAAYSSYVRCTNPDSATLPLIDSLRGAGADLVIGLTHRFIHEDSATMANEPRLDAILGGHEHDGRRIVFGNRVLIKAHSNARSAALVTFERIGTGW